MSLHVHLSVNNFYNVHLFTSTYIHALTFIYNFIAVFSCIHIHMDIDRSAVSYGEKHLWHLTLLARSTVGTFVYSAALQG